MNYEISITLQLDRFDTAVYEYCKESGLDYTKLIEKITNKLWELDGVSNVCFSHTAWMQFDLGIDDFAEAEKETKECIREVSNVFSFHGITI